MSVDLNECRSTVDLITELRYRFDLASSWVRFAEAKHGTVIVISAGLLWAINSTTTPAPEAPLPNALMDVATACILLGAIVSLTSYLPTIQRFNNRLWHPLRRRDSRCHASSHVLFFGDVARLTRAQFERALIKELKLRSDEVYPVHAAYIAQIYNNSTIAYRKMRLFSTSASLMIFASAAAIFALLIA